MEPRASSSSPAAFDVLGLVRRRSPFIVVGLVVGAVLGYGYAQSSPVSYSSTASVLVTPTGVDDAVTPSNGQGKSAINLSTEAQLITSIPVIARAKTILATSESTSALGKQVTSSVPANTTILGITAVDPTAIGAQRIAEAFATAYLANRQATAADVLKQETALLTKQVSDVRKALQSSTGKLATTASDSPDHSYAQAETNVLTSQLSQLSQTLATLQSTTISPGRIIADAPVPTKARGLPKVALIVAGLLAGLCLGLVFALLRERGDRRLYTAADVERKSDVPVLLELRHVGRGSSHGATLRYPTAQAGRELLRLRNSLITALPSGERVVLIAGAAAGSRASATVAAQLAVSLARGGSSVLLMGGDAETSVIDDLTGDSNAVGLSEVLGGSVPVGRALRQVEGVKNLRVLPTGQHTEALSSQLQSAAFARRIQELRTGFDFLIIQTGSTDGSADAQSIARSVDACLLVLGLGAVTLQQVQDASTQMHEVGLDNVSAVTVTRGGRRHGGQSDKDGSGPRKPSRTRKPDPAATAPVTSTKQPPAAERKAGNAVAKKAAEEPSSVEPAVNNPSTETPATEKPVPEPVSVRTVDDLEEIIEGADPAEPADPAELADRAHLFDMADLADRGTSGDREDDGHFEDDGDFEDEQPTDSEGRALEAAAKQTKR
jgi:polysaccharide biosynthesis transport protein